MKHLKIGKKRTGAKLFQELKKKKKSTDHHIPLTDTPLSATEISNH